MGRPLPPEWQETPVIGEVAKWLNDVCEEIQNFIGWVIGQITEYLPKWIVDVIDWFWSMWRWLKDKIWSFFTDPIQFIKSGLKWVYDMLPDWVKGIFDWLWKIYWSLGNAVYNFFTNPIEALKGLAEKVWSMIPDWVKAPLEWLKKLGDLEVKLIIDFFTDPIGTLRGLADTIWGIIPDWLKDWIKGAKETAENLWNNIPKWLNDAKETISKGLGEARDRIVATFDGALSSVAEAIKGFGRQLWEGIINIPDILKGIGEAIIGALRVAWDAVKGFGEWVWNGVIGIGKGMVKLGQDALKGLIGFFKEVGQAMFNILIEPIGKLFDESTRQVHKAVGLGSPQPIMAVALAPLAPMVGLWLVSGLIAEAAKGAKDTEIELFGCKIRPGLVNVIKALDLRDVMASMFQGYTMGLAMAYMQGTILEQLRRESLEAGRPIPPDPQTCAWMLRKGLISEDLYKKALARQGIMAEFEEPYLENIWMYPPYQDMIKIFVREAYEKTWPEMFELKLQDYPKDFGKWMEMIGYKEEWAKRLWAAHWVLPSTGQVYEMLWRGLKSPYTGATMTEEDVRRFLKEADIDPRWRENLVEIAYKLPGRILARWGVEWGVWPVERMEEFLRADGIHPDWIPDALKAEKANIFREHISSVRSILVSKYQDGFISEEELKNRLQKLGYPDEAITYIVWSAQERYDYDWKKEMAKAYIDAYEDDKISADELRSALSGLGMVPDRIEHIIEITTLKKQKAPPPPETLEKRLRTLEEREASLMRQLEDKRTDLEDLKKLYEAEMAIYDERIEEQKMRIQVAKAPEAKAREEQELKILEARKEKARVRYEARISDLEETIRMLEDRLDEVRTEISALKQALGTPTAS